MFGGEDVSLLCHRDVGIYFGDIDGTVTEHFLDVADVNIRFEQAGCKSMPEHMRCDMKVDSGKVCVFIDHSADCLIRQRPAGLVCEKMPAAFNF
jgi:hypothetical protein